MNTPTPHQLLAALDEATAEVRKRWAGTPALGIVAGSGLTALGDLVADAVRIPYHEIPNMPRTAVVGHAGELVLGELEGLPVAVLSGRVHRYEGHPMTDCVFGVRMLGRLGTPRVLLTNAAGGIIPTFAPGTLCRITDHINATGENPLFGPNIDALGPRFPDMTQAYCPELGATLERAAAEANVTLERGVYAMMCGPSYETPAEIRMLKTQGATLVGMSTVPEAIALRHMGVTVTGISVVSNYAAGIGEGTLDHSEVKEAAAAVGPRLLATIRALAKSLAQ
ncbi:MAG: purine-nucleoside phosphorylase [Myxococcota bacterium]